MRLGAIRSNHHNTQFLKPASASKNGETGNRQQGGKNRIWLNLTNTEGAFKQTLIGYVNGRPMITIGDMMPSVLTETVISTLQR
jgi:hypothetical protein